MASLCILKLLIARVLYQDRFCMPLSFSYYCDLFLSLWDVWLKAGLTCILALFSSNLMILVQLNKESWKPVRDVRTNCMSRSKLQLPESTLLVLDETHLEAGQLNASGIRNLQVWKASIDISVNMTHFLQPWWAQVLFWFTNYGRSSLVQNMPNDILENATAICHVQIFTLDSNGLTQCNFKTIITGQASFPCQACITPCKAPYWARNCMESFCWLFWYSIVRQTCATWNSWEGNHWWTGGSFIPYSASSL